MSFSALDSAILGPLFVSEAMRAVFDDSAKIAAMLRVEHALAQAQADLGIVPAALVSALGAIQPGQIDLAAMGRATALAGVPVIAFVAQVQKLLPKDLEAHFHKGTTTQDIDDTALVLQLQQAFDALMPDLKATLAGLLMLAATHGKTPCAGRTYGQHAAPITFGAKVSVWGMGIADVASRCSEVRQRAAITSLGGPVGILTAMGDKSPQVQTGFARALGLSSFPVSWHTIRTRMAETGFWLAELIGTLAKMATDIAFLTSTEVGEVAEPYIAGRGGSSAMPHKRNPVSCAIILAAHTAAKGHVVALLDAMAGAHERPVGLWHAEWHALPQLFGLASGALREAKALAEGLEVSPERMLKNLDATNGLLFSDALAGKLAPLMGRGKAHDLVEHASMEVRRSGQHLRAFGLTAPEIAQPDLQAAWASAFDLNAAIMSGNGATERAASAIRAILSQL